MRNTDGNGSDNGLNEEEEHNVSNWMLEFLRTTRAVWRYNDVCGCEDSCKVALSSLCWTSFVCVRHTKTSMAGHNVLRMGTLGTGQDDLQNDPRMTGGGRRLA